MHQYLLIALTLALFTTSAWADVYRSDVTPTSDIYDDCVQEVDLDRALRGCTQIIERGERETLAWREDAYYNRGLAYLRKGEYDRAITDNTKAIELDPVDAFAYNNRGYAHFKKGEYDHAIVDYNKAIELDPKYVKAYNNRGAAHEQNGDKDKAIADYRKVLEFSPSTQDAKDGLARLVVTATGEQEVSYTDCAQREDIGRRIGGCTQIIERGEREAQEDRSIAYFYRGYAYSRKDDYDRAILDYNKAIELYPKFALAYNNRGYAHEQKGDKDKAIADYRKVLDLDPSDQYAKDALALLGVTATGEQEDSYSDCAQREDFDRTLRGCTQIIGRGEQETREWRATAYVYRGNAYFKNSEFDRAIADYNKAIELDPRDAITFNNRGLSYFEKGEYERAIADNTTAIELDPKYAPAYNGRGLAYERQGDKEKAGADYRKVLEIDPTNRFAKDALKAIETTPPSRN